MKAEPSPEPATPARLQEVSTWREDVLQEADRIKEMLSRSSGDETTLAALAGETVPGLNVDVRIVVDNLALARDSARKHRDARSRMVAWWTGIDIERSWVSLHAAKQALFSVVKEEDARVQIPVLRSKLQQYISAGSAERAEYEGWLKPPDIRESTLTSIDRSHLRTIRAAVDRESDLAHANIRRFRNTLLRLIAGLVVILFVLIFDSPSHSFLPICAAASGQAAPGATTGTKSVSSAQGSTQTSGESCPAVWQLELVGLVGGLLAAAAALRKIPTTGTPYGLRNVQAVVKVPMGALTAIVGVMLLQSGIISALQAQATPVVFVYALVFGYSQETVTRLIDDKASSLTTSAAGAASSTGSS
jgi:hypothetical protein